MALVETVTDLLGFVPRWDQVILTALYAAFLYDAGGAGRFLGAAEPPRRCLSATPDPALVDAARVGLARMAAAGRRLEVATNPFEYWITYDKDPEYKRIMTDIEAFLEKPGDHDATVSEVFTDEMFAAVEERMDGVGWDSVRSYWEDDFRDRRAPDRIDNTIHVGGSDEPVCRPTVINMYGGDLSNLGLWWDAWEKLGEVTEPPYKMIQLIRKAKAVSLPLQTMCGAISDAILVHMGPSAEITALVEGSFEEGAAVPITRGDILAITATDRDGVPFVVMSFHGDTNGLATKPVLSAVVNATDSDAALTTHKAGLNYDTPQGKSRLNRSFADGAGVKPAVRVDGQEY